MNRTIAGWVWVAGQVVVLVVLVVLPGNDHWPTPGWLDAAAGLLFLTGLAIVGVGALGLGSALTPSPVPTADGSLRTDGLYRWVRHPIYTGVLLVVVAITARSGSWLQLVVALAAFVFFDRKAAWEERQLEARYPDYAAYAAATPKFVPRPWQARR